MSRLFSPLTLRGVTLRNRIAVSPMCEYSSDDGFANDWHLVHLGSRAVGGAGLVLTEAISVTPEGRISPADLGIWKDEHVEGLARIARFVTAHGAAFGTQLAHAGRKGSTDVPWRSRNPVQPGAGGWEPLGPSARAFDADWLTPRAMSEDDILATIRAFAEGARRTLAAGGTVTELHAAHGYLIHQFLSPLANMRDDRWGGSFDNRVRLAREVTRAVRAEWPERFPLFVRISATDYAAGGWDVDQSVELARLLKEDGADLIDVSSGGLVPVPSGAMAVGPLYQVPFANAVRHGADIATGAVGMIVEPHEAESVLADGHADLVFIARELLRDPYWPLHAARALGDDVAWPEQYQRAAGPRAKMLVSDAATYA